MKKNKILLLGGILLLLVLAVIAQLILQRSANLNLPQAEQRGPFVSEKTTAVTPTLKVSQITVSIVFAGNKKVTGNVSGQTAYEALTQLVKTEGLTVSVKEYKYGVMVEKIADIGNSKTQAWIYSVNGKPAQIASDRYLVHPGDKVEWKYQKME